MVGSVTAATRLWRWKLASRTSRTFARVMPLILAGGVLSACGSPSTPEIVRVLVSDNEVAALPPDGGSTPSHPVREQHYQALPADFVTIDFRVPSDTISTVELLGVTLPANRGDAEESALYAACSGFVRLTRQIEDDAGGRKAWRATVRMPRNVTDIDSRVARMATGPYAQCRPYDPNRGIPLVINNLGSDQATQSGAQASLTVRLVGRTLPLSVFSLNFNGMGTCETKPCISYAEKARRMVDWFKTTKVAPDIIALQEMHGYLVIRAPLASCDGLTSPVHDWLDIHMLLDFLQRELGITYRVAYMTGSTGAHGALHQCQVYPGQAVLYRPQTLTNLTVALADSWRNEEFDAPSHRFPHMRRSLPVCGPVADLGLVGARLDRKIRSSGCGSDLFSLGSVRSPAGPAPAVFGPDGHIIGTAVEFSFRISSRARVVLFNFHPNSHKGPRDQPYLEDLVAAVAGPRRGDLYYPPIITGDLNNIEATLPETFRFDVQQVARQRPGEQQMTYVGDSGYWSSVQSPRWESHWAPREDGGCPPSWQERFSDHCGLLTRFY